ncbi:MAG: TonB-dependent receptor [Bryobacteraceae bacterium]
MIFSLAAIAAAQSSPADSRSLASLDLESLLQVQVVTASKFSESAAHAPAMMSVVTAGEIERFGGLTLREVLSRVAGLNMTTSMITDASILAVRGQHSTGTGVHVLYLINGRPVREVLEGGVMTDLLESFPVEALERIEVVKGPGSVLYGSNAFAGVVNLITKRPDGNSVSVNTLGGEGGAGRAGGTVSAERAGVRVFAAMQSRHDPVWRMGNRARGLLDLTESGPVFETVSRRYGSGTGAFVEAGFRGLTFQSAYSESALPYQAGPISGPGFWRRGFTDLGYSFSPSGRWRSSLNVTHTHTGHDFSQQFPSFTREASETVVEWGNTIEVGDRDRLAFGALVNRMRGSATLIAEGGTSPMASGSRMGAAAYAQWEHAVSRSLSAIAGVQLNKIGNLAVDAVPRVGLVWKPAPRLGLKALYGRAYRAPTINELWLDYPLLQGDPALRPERMATAELAMTYESKHVSMSLSGYQSRMSDVIVQEYVRFPGIYRNLGRASFRGVEWEGKYAWSDRWMAIGSVLYQHASDWNAASSPPWIPPVSVKAGGSYAPSKRFSISVFDAWRAAVTPYRATPNPPAVARHWVDANLRWQIRRELREDIPLSIAVLAHAVNLGGGSIWMPIANGAVNTAPASRGRTVWFGLEFSLNGK